MKEIVQKENPVLRLRASAVPLEEIKGTKIQSLLNDMREMLAREIDGVGLAAPQIGESLRIFIISEAATQYRKRATKDGTVKAEKPNSPNSKLVFINPELVKVSREKKELEEGCLSVRPLYGTVKRSTKVTIRAYDENGQVFERGGSGLLAQIFQHEIDHLNGILFTDTAKDIHDMPEEDIKAIEKGHADHDKEHDKKKL